MEPIAEWLETLGLGQYGKRFVENGIDISALAHLTDQDFKDLGVLLGHRRKMQAAIAELPGNAPRTTGPEATPEPKPREDAERRHLTVMFTDLVGSTALSTQLDPEDLRSVISAYHKCVAQTVARFDGFVAKYMGDGALIYFGYPQAHEDDAERAVRAGLALVEAVPKLKTAAGAPLQVRIGIATGLVVVGDLIGSGEAQERGIVGETPNLAARLQAMAEPKTVVIADSTRRLLGNLFELQDLGPKDLKGLAGSTRAWMALQARSVNSRFEALHASSMTALVGREEELELLLRRWARAKTTEGQVVLLTGEAGIGKSRLTAALLERLTGEPHTRLRYFCSPQHTDSAFYPIIGQMERAAGLGHDDPPQVRLDKLNALLARTSTSIQDAALFAEMLSLPDDGRYPALDLTAEQRRQRTLEALTSQLTELGRQNPILMIFEDVHWIDPTSLEALGRIMDRIKGLPTLLIVTFRPEFDAPWVGQSYVTSLTLNRLGEREAAAIVAHLAGDKGLLAADVIAEIVERTDGIPLFVEEMTKAVLEAERGGEARRTVAAVPSPALAVPPSLHASLMARLDRLGSAKEAAQIGAAIGREFSYALLAAVVGKPEEELHSGFDRLIDAGLLFQQGVPPYATFRFKHALIQDAAYGTLLREGRRDLHARIAKTLKEHFTHIRETQPETLAHHYSKAGLADEAIEWWSKAGERAMGGSAYDEAIGHFNKAIGLAEGLPPTANQKLLRLRLETNRGNALLHARGQSAPETSTSFARARDLAAEVEEPTERASAYYGLWAGSYLSGDLASMRDEAEAFLNDAKRWPGTPEFGIAHRLFGTTCWFAGNYLDARLHIERGLRAYHFERDQHLAPRFGYDVSVSSMTNLALVLWPLGDVDHAVDTAEEALALAQRTGHKPSVAVAHNYTCNLAALRRRPDQAAVHARALLDDGPVLFQGTGKIYSGWVRCWSGDPDGEAEMRTGIAMVLGHGHLWQPTFLTMLAEIESHSGRPEAGLATLDTALTTMCRTGERWFAAEVNRMRGEILLNLQPFDAAAAEGAFMRAIEIARSQHTRTFELRAALSLAKLYRIIGRNSGVRELLAAAATGFTEGPEVPEVAGVNRLLESLDESR
jgi:class 3 adenylate cyclase/tetratricopeptide (TPR) repeat protein